MSLAEELRAEGFAEGYAEGYAETTIKLVKRLLAEKAELAFIADVSGLSLAEIMKIHSEEVSNH